MALTEKQKRFLRQQAHHRKVIVIIGQHGISDNVISEIDIALQHHELVKVRINTSDRDIRHGLIEQIAQRTHSDVIQKIGHLGVFYRQSKKPTISLPNI
jgi:RNA-binding protein